MVAADTSSGSSLHTYHRWPKDYHCTLADGTPYISGNGKKTNVKLYKLPGKQEMECTQYENAGILVDGEHETPGHYQTYYGRLHCNTTTHAHNHSYHEHQLAYNYFLAIWS